MRSTNTGPVAGARPPRWRAFQRARTQSSVQSSGSAGKHPHARQLRSLRKRNQAHRPDGRSDQRLTWRDRAASLWVALRDASDADIDQMRAEFGLHELAVEDAKHGHQRPKIEEYGDTVFAVTHTVEFSPTDELTVGEAPCFRRARTSCYRCAITATGISGRAQAQPSASRTCCAMARATRSLRARRTRWSIATSP